MELAIGQRCKRTTANIAMYPKNHNPLEMTGTVKSLAYQGQDFFGAHITTAEVEFDNGETVNVVTSLLEPQARGQ